MQLTPLLLAASLALTATSMPIMPGTADTASLTTSSKGQRRCCPPFAPKNAPPNKHFPPPKLPCDPNCNKPGKLFHPIQAVKAAILLPLLIHCTAGLSEHDKTGGHMIPAHAKEYQQKAPVRKKPEKRPPKKLRESSAR